LGGWAANTTDRGYLFPSALETGGFDSPLKKRRLKLASSIRGGLEERENGATGGTIAVLDHKTT